MPTKTYVLLDDAKSTAPIYQRVNKDQRVKIEMRPVDHPFLQLTFMDDADKKNKTIRLKLTSNSIYLDEQIKEGILANEKFTQAERESVKFKFGVLMQDNETVQKFLEASPQFDQFEGKCVDVKKPMYKLLDKVAIAKRDAADVRRRLAAANKIMALDLQQGQDLMIKLNGSYFTPPELLEDVHLGLMDWLDATNEAGVDAVLKETESIDDRLTVLIGKAINQGILSFDQEPGAVSKKLNNKWVAVKNINSDMDPLARQKLFAEFLQTKEGKTLADDIQKDLNKK